MILTAMAGVTSKRNSCAEDALAAYVAAIDDGLIVMVGARDEAKWPLKPLLTRQERQFLAAFWQIC